MLSKPAWSSLALFLGVVPAVSLAQTKPSITLDEYLNTTEITAARLSPDGASAVIATGSPDWKNSAYRHDLWVWTARAGLQPLTHGGSEEDPQWSPDGKWIAFTSDRALAGEDASAEGDSTSESAKAQRIWVISAAGGEALPLYSEKLDTQTFAWSPDSSSIYFSVTQPLTHEQEDTKQDQLGTLAHLSGQEFGEGRIMHCLASARND